MESLCIFMTSILKLFVPYVGYSLNRSQIHDFHCIFGIYGQVRALFDQRQECIYPPFYLQVFAFPLYLCLLSSLPSSFPFHPTACSFHRWKYYEHQQYHKHSLLLGVRPFQVQWRLGTEDPRMHILPVLYILGHEAQDIGHLPGHNLFLGLKDKVGHTDLVFKALKPRPTISGLSNAEATHSLWRVHDELQELLWRGHHIMGTQEFIILNGKLRLGEGSVNFVE